MYFYSEGLRQKKPSGDILSSLFDDGNPLKPPVCDGREHSVCLFLCQTQCFPKSAMLSNNNLLLVVRMKENTFLRVYHSSSTFEFHHHQLPAFPNHVLFQYNIESHSGPLPSPKPRAVTIAFRPAMLLICCQSSAKQFPSCPVSVVSDTLFCQLFGIEFSLGHSTVAMTGSRTGTVSFVDTRGLRNPSPSADYSTLPLPNTLCNLDQPVVSIHVFHLPVHSDSTVSPLNNTLLLVGREGRLILFTESHLGKVAPFITEFHIAGPILSSVVVPEHSFVYCSSRGIYRVCLEPSCLLKSNPSSTTSILVPHIHFKSPTCILPSAVIMFITGVSPTSKNDIYSMTAVDMNGSVIRFQLKSCKETSKVAGRVEVGTGMKSNMSALVKTQEKTTVTKTQLMLVDSALKELNQSLSTLSSLVSSDSRSFSCILSPETERVGVNCMAMFVRVELRYTGENELVRGWSLLLSSQCSNSTLSQSVSLSLTGLHPGDCLKQRLEMNLESGSSALFSVTATLCYSPTHLHSLLHKLSHYADPTKPLLNLLPPDGVSILLCSSIFDALHFLRPCGNSIPALSHHSLQPLSSHSPKDSYSFELSISHSNLVQADIASSTTDRYSKTLLDMLLPQNIVARVLEPGIYRTEGCSYDGSIVSFEMGSERDKVNLRLSSSGSASCMVDIIGSTSRRLQRVMERKTSHDTLAHLKVYNTFLFIFSYIIPIE